MKENFEKFLENISLTENQWSDAKTKYTNVCKALHKEFYTTEYSGSSKFLFGSYKKKTAIRPINSAQDVDVLFKIPAEVFEKYQSQKSGQSNLLTRVKDTLKKTFSTTDKIKNWGKVVLVEFSEGKHNVEVLPAFENEDGVFTIPNTEDGGSWDNFDPKIEIDAFSESNKDSGGLARILVKMIKTWKRQNKGLSLKSFEIDNFSQDFLVDYEFTNYQSLIEDFFCFLSSEFDSSYVETALSRSKKASSYIEEGKTEEAVEEYKKVFGSRFPKYIGKSLSDVAPNEQFIEDLVLVNLQDNYSIKLNCEITQDGWRPTLLNKISFLSKSKKLRFFIEQCNVPEPFSIKWKVRNFGEEAESKNDLRGEVLNDNGSRENKENTKYKGEHFVECYVIKNNVCVAKDIIIVPIKK